MRRCEDLLLAGKFAIDNNDGDKNFCVLGEGVPKKCFSARKDLFTFFIDIQLPLKARLPKKNFLVKAQSLYEDYWEYKCEEGVEPEKFQQPMTEGHVQRVAYFDEEA